MTSFHPADPPADSPSHARASAAGRAPVACPAPRPGRTRVAHPHRLARPVRVDERGQSTVEYALLLLGAAAIALVVVAWVTRTDLIGRLFDTVIGRILEQA